MRILVFSAMVGASTFFAVPENSRFVSFVSGDVVENIGVIDGDMSSMEGYRILTLPVAGKGYCKRAVITMEGLSPIKEESGFARALTLGGLKFEYAIALDRGDCYGRFDELTFFRATGIDSSERPLTRFLELLSAFRKGGALADTDMVIESDDPERLECLKENKRLGITSFWRVVPAASDEMVQYVSIFSGCDDDLGRPMAAYIDYDEYSVSYRVKISFHFG